MSQVIARPPSRQSLIQRKQQAYGLQRDMSRKSVNESKSKRQFLEVVSNRQKNHANPRNANLRASTVSLPVTSRPYDSQMSNFNNCSMQANQNKFLERRSQSCVYLSQPYSLSSHALITITRPVSVLIKERIIPAKFQYNPPIQTTNNRPYQNQPILRTESAPKQFRSAFQNIPSKMDILTNQFNIPSGRKSFTLVTSRTPFIPYQNPNAIEQREMILKYNQQPHSIQKPIPQFYGNQANYQSVRPNQISSSRGFEHRNTKLTLFPQNQHLKTPQHSTPIKIQEQINNRKKTNRTFSSGNQNFPQVSFRPDIQIKQEVKQLRIQNVQKCSPLLEHNTRIINQIDKSIDRITQGFNKIKNQYKQTDPIPIPNTNTNTNQQTNLSNESKESIVPSTHCVPNPLETQLVKTSNIKQCESANYRNQKTEQIPSSLVTSRAQSNMSHQKNQQYFTFSRYRDYKQFKEFKEFRELKEKISAAQDVKPHNRSNSVLSNICNEPFKEMRQLLEDYKELRVLKQNNRTRKVGQRLHSSRGVPN